MGEPLWYFHNQANSKLNIQDIEEVQNEKRADIIVDAMYLPPTEIQRIVARDARTDELIARGNGPDGRSRVYVVITVGSQLQFGRHHEGPSFLHYKCASIEQMEPVKLKQEVLQHFRELNPPSTSFLHSLSPQKLLATFVCVFLVLGTLLWLL